MKDPLDKIFMGKTKSKWFTRGRKSVLRELEWWLRDNKYPINNPIRKLVKMKLDANCVEGEA